MTLGISVKETYCSRPRVGNFPSVLCPLVVVAVFVGKRSIEDITDISHRVHTDCRTLENRALTETHDENHKMKA